VGRYLYQLDCIWVEIEQKGKSSVIKENQYSKLEAEYNKAIARIFKAPVVPTEQKSSLVLVTPSNVKPAFEPSSTTSTKPKTGKQSAESGTPTIEEQHEEVINGIAAIITTVKDGVPLFSESEKDEARKTVKGTRINEQGLADLKNFKDFLSDELDKRVSQKAA